MAASLISQYARYTVILLAALAGACAAKAKPAVAPQPLGAYWGLETIGELKTFEEGLGEDATDNFLRVSERPVADERCYFTGKLQLPEFYSGLRMIREDQPHCEGRAADNDVFFYQIQAVATGEETVTASLAEAPVERVLMVVPHEDFHNQLEAAKAPVEVAESAATLVGFLTASAFAKEKLGESSAAYQRLALDAELFLKKSLIVNRYYDRVSALYADFRSGKLTMAQALEGKAALFAQLRESCSGITPEPISFNRCPSALNNAGLAFDRTYTRNYPIMYALFDRVGSDPAALVSTLKRLMANWPSEASDAGELLGALGASQ
jgi:hypothetical protein